MAGDPPVVLVVEDHDLLSASVSMALRVSGWDARTVHPGSDLHLQAVVTELTPALLLLDLDLGEGCSPGEKLVGPLSELGPDVLLLTGTEQPHRIHAGLMTGAIGYVHKREGIDALNEALQRWEAGQPPTPAAELRRLRALVAAQDADRARRLAVFQQLSPREAEVLTALMDGQVADDIAREDHVSIATVRTQIRAILRKLGVGSQIAAVAKAHAAGWPGLDRE